MIIRWSRCCCRWRRQSTGGNGAASGDIALWRWRWPRGGLTAVGEGAVVAVVVVAVVAVVVAVVAAVVVAAVVAGSFSRSRTCLCRCRRGTSG